ncbi:MAG TPA: lysylphosphatidylglycerol synthase domain-containing protein [Actinomycetes bacterium]|nr:lysylphosphatidylglycerol synthase domain-containing protein [Actinomycetes bacterium]
MRPKGAANRSVLGWARLLAGALVLAVATGYLLRIVDRAELSAVARAVAADPAGLALALVAYGAAFVLRAWSWRWVLPGLPAGQSWAALHVSLLGNHLLPVRLGEVLRVTSVLRRTRLPARPVVASTIALRSADLAVVVLLALVAAPALLAELAGPWRWLALAVPVVLALAGLHWLRRLRRDGAEIGSVRAATGFLLALAALLAWALEAAVIWQIAAAAGFHLSAQQAIAVTAVTIAAQAVALTPGGFGSYEAAATAALVALGVPAGAGFAIALTTHAVKTGYALVTGAIALAVPAPGYWGRLRLPRRLPARPVPDLPEASPTAPVVAFLPVHNEQDTVGDVVARLPARVGRRPVVVIVVDDGSTDASAARARLAGATVLAQPVNLGLGAAVRRGLAEAVRLDPAAVVYLDADGEYFPEDIDGVVAPVLAGTADYVVGSRFAGRIERMYPHRRLGNWVLTRWLRWVSRQPDLTDGQSGYRAFAPAAAAAAEVIHDYNYAQVLTLDLLGKGFRYAEVPIGYRFRQTGTSFVRLWPYLRRVIPAVHRELNADLRGAGQSSTTWTANRSRAADQASSSNPPLVSASTAS